MKSFIFILIIISSATFANDSADKLSSIKNIIEENDTSIDNYHYGRIKGYLEGLNLERGFTLPTNLTNSQYRVNLVALKTVLKNLKSNYPEVTIQDTIKTIEIRGIKNGYGGCMLFKKKLANGFEHKEQLLEVGFRGDLLGAKFNEYTKPQIEKCSKNVIDKVEKNLL